MLCMNDPEILRDLHVHTTFSDGKASPEEMVRRALAIGMDCIGFSDHSHSPQPGGDSWSMPLHRRDEYRQEIARLKKAYAGKIEILCGAEQDLYSDAPTDGFDYLLGAMHFIRVPGEDRFFSVDWTADNLRRAAEEGFGGDPYALCEAYYEQLSALPDVLPNCFAIAHFDLISVFQEQSPLFDENHPRYVAAWQRAADTLLKMRIPFEINTGAISRGYRTTPYPSAAMREYIRSRGGTFILASDSHRPETLCYGFETWG